MIDLYTSPTPNGHKASCALEELEIPYETHAVNLVANQQKEPSFLKMNPNGPNPILSRSARGGGTSNFPYNSQEMMRKSKYER